MASEPENKPPILHILVVGFHHKLGCQVEFSHPPLIAGSSGRHECPSGWKYLPTLALPDGSHNFMEDTVFFNLPSLFEPAESIYGVSCYRQIPVEQLKIRTADVTRSTVQKSVCILSRLPIYGYIEVKLALIADAFFEQGDFSGTELLVKAYQQLNACLLGDDEVRRPLRHFHVGLSLREIVLHWRHKTLMLFKLLLLQRRVVCFGSPVRGMCALILGVASLIPRLLEKGFQEVACVRTSRPLSPMPDFTDSLQREAAAEVEAAAAQKLTPESATAAAGDSEDFALVSSAASVGSLGNSSGNTSPQTTTPNSQSQESNFPSNRDLQRADSTESGTNVAGGEMGAGSSGGGTDGSRRNGRSSSLTREASVDTLASNLAALCAVNPDEYRAPISIFASGNLCLPYLSLPYMDLLSDPMVLSYVIGTSNVLFQQKRQLADVLVDIDAANLETHDAELRRQLVLSTEDLRYMDFILKHVQTPKEDAEGSEYWIREQFQGYILALLRTTVAQDATPKDNDHFNAHFVGAFKRTQCFQEWYDVRPEPEFFDLLPAGHPFAGTLSVADMKLKIAQTMQNSESGRKINQAVNTTSRAVGGAISQAKGAFSSWWSSITTAPPQGGNGGGGSSNIGSISLNGECEETEPQQQTQGISVTFQNHQNDADVDVAGVSIHLVTNSGCNLELLEEALESHESTSEAAQQQHGIVEIGHEAEVLNRSDASDASESPAKSTPSMRTSTGTGCGTDLATAAIERPNGDVYIV
ncbi:late secretory pathway protein AVL9 homolog [Scaptodrosophila lebanonensis]|uniref:Late secretory pathway protein AVL9 homolog n=1 Tax=Drosophila lebanonensis TaxID=7225 RepID=A0A6J2U405_DROLE|nr:late secretory pathway protein AVL9 homolog [Scaptodrosophila lebanonensis]